MKFRCEFLLVIVWEASWIFLFCGFGSSFWNLDIAREKRIREDFEDFILCLSRCCSFCTSRILAYIFIFSTRCGENQLGTRADYQYTRESELCCGIFTPSSSISWAFLITLSHCILSIACCCDSHDGKSDRNSTYDRIWVFSSAPKEVI